MSNNNVHTTITGDSKIFQKEMKAASSSASSFHEVLKAVNNQSMMTSNKFAELGSQVAAVSNHVQSLAQKISESLANITPALQQMVTTLGTVNNEVAQPVPEASVVDNILQKIEELFELKNRIENLMGEYNKLPAFYDSVEATIGTTKDLFKRLEKDAQPVLEAAKNWFDQLKNSQLFVKLETMAVSAAMSIWEGVCTVATAVTTALGTAFTFLTSPIGVIIVVILSLIVVGLWLVNHWEEVQAFAIAVWNGIMNILQGFCNFMSNVFVSAWNLVFHTISGYLNSFFSRITNIWNSIIQVFTGVIDFITGIFTGNWSKAWEGITNIFGGIFGGIVAIAKAPINAIISLINGAIGALNKVQVKIPDWIPGIGGQRWGLNIPQIPQLLHGTDNWQGGFAFMNEGGRGELTYLPNGSQVIPHDISVKYAKEAARANTTAGTIDLQGVLEGVSIYIDNSTHVDGTPLLEKAAQYTIRKMGNQYRAMLSKKGV